MNHARHRFILLFLCRRLQYREYTNSHRPHIFQLISLYFHRLVFSQKNLQILIGANNVKLITSEANKVPDNSARIYLGILVHFLKAPGLWRHTNENGWYL